MKKALSLILTVCMLLTTVAGIGTVFAEDIMVGDTVLAGEGAQLYVEYAAYDSYADFYDSDEEEFTPENTTDDGELIMARVFLKGVLTADTLAIGLEYDPSKVLACTTKASGAIQYVPSDSKYKAANSMVLIDEDSTIRVSEHHDTSVTTTSKNVLFAVVTGEYENTDAADEYEVIAFKFKRLDTETALTDCGFGIYAPVTEEEKGAYYTSWIYGGEGVAYSEASDAVMNAGGVYVHPEMFGDNVNGGGEEPPIDEPTLVSIALTVDEDTLDIDGTATLTATATYSDQSSADVTSDVTFNVDTDGVVELSDNVVTALAEGTATITASIGDITSNGVTITVNAPAPVVELVGLVVSVENSELEIGDTTNVTVMAQYNIGDDVDVTDQATITATGAVSVNGNVVTAEEAGTGYVSATFNNRESDTVEITVTAPAPVLTSVVLTVDPTTLDIDGTANVTVKAIYSDDSEEDATEVQFNWTNDIISIEEAQTFAGAILTALAAGETTLTATVDNVVSNEVVITVNEPAPVEKANFSLNAGEVYEDGNTRYVNVTLNLDQNTGNGLYAIVLEIEHSGIFTLANVDDGVLVKQPGDLLPYEISVSDAINCENGTRIFYVNESNPLRPRLSAFTDDTSEAPLLTLVFEVADDAYGEYPISFVHNVNPDMPDLSDNAYISTTDNYNYIDGVIDLGEEPSTPDVTVTSIDFSVSDTELEVNGTTSYQVIVNYSDDTEDEITETAVINGLGQILTADNGVLTAIAAGTATLSVTVDNVTSDEITVTVTEPAPPVVTVTSIDFSVSDTELEVNGTTTYQVIVNYSDDTEDEITETAVINGLGDILTADNGVLTAIAAGTATLSVTVDNVTSDEITVTVTAPVVEPQVTAVVIELEAGASTDLTVDDTLNYTVKKIYDNGEDEDITAEAVVDIEGDAVTAENGVITAIAAGTATLTVSVGDITSDPISINVTEPAPVVTGKGNVKADDEDVNMADVELLAQYLANWTSARAVFENDTVKNNANVYRADQFYGDKVADFEADFGEGLNPNGATLFLNSKDLTKLLQYVNDLGAETKVWNVDLNAAN